MKGQDIQKCIYDEQNGFAKVYRNAAPFVDSGALWDFCLAVVTNETRLACLAFANDLGIPPVRSLLWFYENEKTPPDDFEFNFQSRQWLGAFMAFVFKNCLGFQSQKERVKVDKYGVQRAAKFLDPPAGFRSPFLTKSVYPSV